MLEEAFADLLDGLCQRQIGGETGGLAVSAPSEATCNHRDVELVDARAERAFVRRRPLAQLLPDQRCQLGAFDGGALTLTHLTRDDFAHSEADESDSEGIVDHMRQVEGTLVAGLVRELLSNGGRRKVSLRATDERVDVSQIARGFGGGGHRQAAGFSTDLGLEETVEQIRQGFLEQRATSRA